MKTARGAFKNSSDEVYESSDKNNDRSVKLGVEVSDGPNSGVKILDKIGDLESAEGKKLFRRYIGAARNKYPFKLIDFELQNLVDTLSAEFPWALNVIEELISGLAVEFYFNSAVPILKFAPIILVGTKGTGKTSLLKRLCQIVDLPTQFISASMPDSGGLLPVSRGWSTTQPSVLFTLMAENKCPNPAVIIDEIDKAKQIEDVRNGNLQAALLSMVGEERYFDSCLLGNVNFSNVSFFATANDASNIYAPLTDRFSVIEMPSPNVKHLDNIVDNIRNLKAKELQIDPSLLPESKKFKSDLMQKFYGSKSLSLRDIKRAYEHDLRAVAASGLQLRYNNTRNTAGLSELNSRKINFFYGQKYKH